MGNFNSSSVSPSTSSALPPLQPVQHCQTERFMGTWFVIAVKPTMFETTCSNAVERYTSTTNKNNDIDIDFQFNKNAPLTSALKSMPQKGWVQGSNKKDSGTWKVSPLWPIKLPYLILEVDDQNYDYTVIGYPSRAYCWIMYRHPVMPQATYDMLVDRLINKHQYSLEGLRQVSQVWTASERERRGLTASEIPDSMLVPNTTTQQGGETSLYKKK